MPYVYLVRCCDGSLYAGSTWDLKRRVGEHNSGLAGAAYTRHRRPVVLAWSAWCDRIEDAYAFERRLMGWGRAKREALIAGDFERLRALSRRRGGRPAPEG